MNTPQTESTMKTLFDFNTPAGIRATADHFDELAESNPYFLHPSEVEGGPAPPSDYLPYYVIPTPQGRFTIRNSAAACKAFALSLRRRAPEAGRPKSGKWGTPKERTSASPLTGIAALDAMRVYGEPRLAAQAIREQLAAQSADMDPADVKRCEKAARELETHIEKMEQAERERARLEAGAKWLESARRVTPKQTLEPGTLVRVDDRYRTLLGHVVRTVNGGGCWEVELCHIQEYRRGVWGMYPVRVKRIGVYEHRQVFTMESLTHIEL